MHIVNKFKQSYVSGFSVYIYQSTYFPTTFMEMYMMFTFYFVPFYILLSSFIFFKTMFYYSLFCTYTKAQTSEKSSPIWMIPSIDL